MTSAWKSTKWQPVCQARIDGFHRNTGIRQTDPGESDRPQTIGADWKHADPGILPRVADGAILPLFPLGCLLRRANLAPILLATATHQGNHVVGFGVS